MPAGKLLIISGLLLTAAGLFLTFSPKGFPLGKLPGDIQIKRDNLSFYFPLTSCLLLSLVATLLAWLFKK